MSLDQDNYRQEIPALKQNIQGIGDRIEEVERQITDVSTCVQEHHSALQYWRTLRIGIAAITLELEGFLKMSQTKI